MKRFFLATFVAALALFVWNAISWMALPFHAGMLNTLPEPVAEAVKRTQSMVETGLYHYPGLDDPDMFQKVEEGPRIPLMMYVAEGSDAFDPMSFVKSFFFNLVSAGLLLLLLTRLADRSLKNVLVTSLIMGLLVGFMSDLPQTSWFLLPFEYALTNMLDHLVGFVLAGWVIQKLALKS